MSEIEAEWRPEFVVKEKDGEIEIGYESEGELLMFNDIYPPERWLDILLDPGEEYEAISEDYPETTAALQLVGLTVVDELLEFEEGIEIVREYKDDIRDMTFTGYSEAVRGYATDIINQI